MLVNNQTRVQQFAFVVAAGDKNTQISNYNPNRNYLKIYNKGPNAIRYRFDAPADVLNGIQLGAGSFDEWPDLVPNQSINFSSTLGSSVILTEGVRPDVR